MNMLQRPASAKHDHDLIRSLCRDDPQATAAEIRRRYEQQTSMRIQVSNVRRILRHMICGGLTPAQRVAANARRARAPICKRQAVDKSRRERLLHLSAQLRPMVERGRFALSDHERDRLAALLEEWINLRERPFFQHGTVTLNYSSEFREVYWAKSPYAATAARGE